MTLCVLARRRSTDSHRGKTLKDHRSWIPHMRDLGRFCVPCATQTISKHSVNVAFYISTMQIDVSSSEPNHSGTAFDVPMRRCAMRSEHEDARWMRKSDTKATQKRTNTPPSPCRHLAQSAPAGLRLSRMSGIIHPLPTPLSSYISAIPIVELSISLPGLLCSALLSVSSCLRRSIHA